MKAMSLNPLSGQAKIFQILLIAFRRLFESIDFLKFVEIYKSELEFCMANQKDWRARRAALLRSQ